MKKGPAKKRVQWNYISPYFGLLRGDFQDFVCEHVAPQPWYPNGY
jgi:hypothetical protein